MASENLALPDLTGLLSEKNSACLQYAVLHKLLQ